MDEKPTEKQLLGDIMETVRQMEKDTFVTLCNNWFGTEHTVNDIRWS